jgi:type I restriction enzyme S subunit
MTLIASGRFNVNNHAHVIGERDGNSVHWFQRFYENRDITRNLTRQGAGRYKLTKAALEKLLMTIPPPDEQLAVIKALDDAAELIDLLERLIAKKQAIKQGMMQQLLTGRTRLPGCTRPWTETRLGEVLMFQAGFPFRSEFFRDIPVGVRLIRNRDLKSDDSIIYYSGEFQAAYIVHKGDILVGMDGDFMPSVWRSPPALLNQRVGRIRPKRCSALYMYFALQAPLAEIQAGTGATTVKHLSHKDVESLTILLPGVVEQEAIAAALSDAEREIAALNARLRKATALKQGMMQELLTGRTRLSVQEPPA